MIRLIKILCLGFHPTWKFEESMYHHWVSPNCEYWLYPGDNPKWRKKKLDLKEYMFWEIRFSNKESKGFTAVRRMDTVKFARLDCHTMLLEICLHEFNRRFFKSGKR